MEKDFNDNIDKYFSSGLEGAGKHVRPSEQEWEKLSQRLEPDRAKRRGMAIPFWLLPAFLILGNLIFIGLWSNASSKQAVMSAQLQSQKDIIEMLIQQKVAAESRIATQPTAIHDTVYQVITKTAKQPLNASFLPQNTAFYGTQSANSTGHPSNTDSQLSQVSIETPGTTLTPSNVAKAATRTTDAVIPMVPKNNTTSIDCPQAIEINPILTQNAAPKQFNWQFGVGIGACYITAVKALEYSRPIAASAQAEYLFGKHWSVGGGVSYLAYSYYIDKTDIDSRLLLKIPDAPSPDALFKYFDGRMQHLIPSVFVRYRQPLWHKLSANIGLGYAARFTLPEVAHCDFLEPDGHDDSYYVDLNVADRLQNAVATLGLEYPLLHGLKLYTDLSSTFDVGTGQKTHPLWAGQLGLRWRLAKY